MNCCINGGNFIRLLFISARLFKFKSKCGQIFCVYIRVHLQCQRQKGYLKQREEIYNFWPIPVTLTELLGGGLAQWRV